MEKQIYPDDAYSRPADDRLRIFETAAECYCPENSVYRAENFIVNDIKLVENEGEACTLWDVDPIHASQATMVLHSTIRRKPAGYSLRVRNRSLQPVDISMIFQERMWEPGPKSRAYAWKLGHEQQLPADSERWLRFDAGEALCLDDSFEGQLQYPGTPAIRLENMKPGSGGYRLELLEFIVHYGYVEDLTVVRLIGDERLVADQRAVFALNAEGKTDGKTIDLEVRRQERVLWRIRLTEEEKKRDGLRKIDRIVPWYLPVGDYKVGLVADGYRVQGEDFECRVENRDRGGFPLAQREMHNGRPTFFLNGAPVALQGYASFDFQPGNVNEFGAAGANLFSIVTDAGMHIHHVSEPTLISPGCYDFGELDEKTAIALQANPNAVLFIRVSLALPPFWTQNHPDDLVRMMTERGLLQWEETGTSAVSFASSSWKQDQTSALRELIRHCKAQPWSERVAGFLVNCGVTEEWFAWGSNDGFYGDYSGCNQRQFAKWLEAQGIAADEPDQAIPSPDARKRSGHDVYPDDPEGRMAAAYHQFNSDLIVELIGHYARVVKEETDERSLVAVYYGYVIQLAGEPRQALAGHGSMAALLRNPDVDVFAGIPMHDYRKLAGGYSVYSSATESILAADKLIFQENDLFSFLHPGHWYTEYDPVDPLGGAVSMHARETANDAVHGAVGYKYSLSSSWHHHPDLLGAFSKQIDVFRKTFEFDRSPVEEIAFLVDDSTFAWTPVESTALHTAHKRLLHALGMSGAPVGVWHLSDADRLPDRIRFVVAPALTAALARDIAKFEALLQRGGRTILAVGAPALVNRSAHRWEPDAPARLLGMPIVIEDDLLSSQMVRVSDGWSVAPDDSFVRPRAYADAAGFLVYEDGKTAAMERPLPDGGRLIWCGVPPLDTGLLRKWAAEAGVHLFAPEGYAVHASRELVSITGPASGIAALDWPKDVTVTDLFDGWRFSGKTFECPFAAGQTRLFHVVKNRPDEETGE